MTELQNILLEHYQRYPQMQPQDAVKLVYQNEFGPGHLINDIDKAKAYLMNEVSQVQGIEQEFIVSIGNGLIRYSVCGLSEEKCLWLVGQMVLTAQNHVGQLSTFKEKLKSLVELKELGYFQFTMDDLMQYLKDYQEQGFPMVSHSDHYRELYHPHYRVIKMV